jgi:predicted permease
MELIHITAPIFLLIALGYGLRCVGGIKEHGIKTLNNFVYWLSLPAVILISFWGVNWYDPNTQAVLISNTVAILLFATLLFLLLRLLRVSKQLKAGIFISALVGNTVYMGFPIGERALGSEGFDIFLSAATPHLVIGIAISIIAIEWFVMRGHNPLRYLKDFLFNPLIISLVGGITLSVLKVSGPIVEIIQQPITMLAATASPIALVTLGAFLRGVFKFSLAGYALIASVLNLAVFPALIYVVGQWLSIPETTVTASVLAAAMPTAVTAFVVAERFNAAPQLVATTLFMSTVLSIFSISGVLLVLL